MVTVLELLTFGERLKELFSLARRQVIKDLIHVCHYLKGGVGMDQALLGGLQQWDKRQQAETHTIAPVHDEQLVDCAVIRHWDTAHGESGVSLTGNVQKPSVHAPECRALGTCLSTAELHGPFQPELPRDSVTQTTKKTHFSQTVATPVPPGNSGRLPEEEAAGSARAGSAQ